MSHSNSTTTMWSRPMTPEQERFYSKHSPKLAVFGWAITVKQIAHTLLALGAWMQIYSWATRAMPFMQPLALPVSLLVLYTLHKVFEVTWTTYWYDRLDNDDRTDSSVYLPVLVLLVLFITEQQGAKMWMASQVKPAQYQDDTKVNSETEAQIAQANQIKAEAIASIEASYKPLIAAKAARYDREIAAWSKKPSISDKDAAFIRQNVAAWERKKDAAIAELQSKKAAEIMSANGAHQESIRQITGRKTTLLQRIDDANGKETQRVESDHTHVAISSWIISVFLVLGIAGLKYSQVRINVKSGILPVRQFTDLDQHGSVFEQLVVAFSDIFKRRGVQLASWIHEKGSPSKPIRTIDGSVTIEPGNYNSHATLPAQTPAAQQNVEINNAIIRFEKLLADFAAATDANVSIMVWSNIQNLRRELCAKGYATDLSLNHARIWAEVIPFDVLNTRYPFPPKQVVEPKQAKQPEQTAQTETVLIAPVSKEDVPDGAELQADGSLLFKQMSCLFKQITNTDGRVIGLKYKGPKSDWTTLGKAEVKSRFGIYAARYKKEASEDVVRGYDMWKWALSRLEANTRIQTDNMESISQ